MALTKIDDRGLKTPVDLLDNEKIQFGTGNDLEIFHDGSHSNITNSGTGRLYLNASQINLHNQAADENMIKAVENAQVELYYDASKKIETTSVGMRLSGNYQANDGYHIYLGTGNDLDLYHDGSHSYIHSDNGELKNRAAIWKVVNEANSEVQIKATENGSVELYYDNSLKFQTKSYGALMPDDSQLYFGTDDDAVIKHTGSHFYMTNGTGNWYIQPKANETAIEIIPDGKVGLRYDNSEKLYTESSGIAINGDLSIESDGYIRVRTTGDNTSTACQLAPDGDAMFQGKVTIGTNASEYANNYLRFKSTGDAYIDHNTTGQDIIFRTSSSSALDTTPLKLYQDGTVNIGQGLNNAKLRFGAGSEFQIWNNGTTQAHIHNTDGELMISCESGHKVIINSGTAGARLAEFNYDDSVELFFNGNRKIETTSTGCDVTGTVNESSDIALKTNIEPIDNVLDKIQQITGYKYQFKDNGHNSMGVTAQDVEKVFPELVHGEEGSKTLQYSGLIGALIESVKELSNKVAALEAD